MSQKLDRIQTLPHWLKNILGAKLNLRFLTAVNMSTINKTGVYII